MADHDRIQNAPTNQGDRMSSERLAVLIIDALVDAGLVKKEDIDRAVAVAAEEIEVRRTLSDDTPVEIIS